MPTSEKNTPERPANISEGFTFDQTSQCWYDSVSGFYYQTASQLYYHGATGIYYRWDPNLQDYRQVDERGVPVAVTPSPTAAPVAPAATVDLAKLGLSAPP